VIQLFALHLGAALHAAALYRAAVQATVDKGRMLAHLAQELAVPLHVVLGSMDLLAPHVDEAGRSGLARLQRQERLLLELTNNVLEYARLETGAQLRPTCVDVPELYRQVRDLAAPLIGDKDVRLEVRVEPGAESVETDLERLRRIMANLAINAVKYTPRGCVQLLAAPANGGIRLAVRDPGAATARSEHARLSGRFREWSGDRPGVGVDLALSQELARLLGTEIVVENGDQEGTTFSLLLPAAAA
jgi:signal transduction histidine kinase